jgi:small subunit ribosomal protein S20
MYRAHMPITESAKKALRNSSRKRDFNIARKTALSSGIKNLRKLVVAGKIEEAKKAFPAVEQAIDKAAKTNVIDKNTASRKKSRLAALLKKVSVK